ncbi:MAG: 2-C-methyl-D-erythritol 4-phosphate cytidylyltransferase [Gammaproteobacteria bacterium]|nr:2-C-methyl-D-erythritol 4-phosphate cytidylyltransferase [Gammaproteobacteria bacterium]
MPADVKYWVVVPAAGSGQRMGSSTAKQYLRLRRDTVLETTLAALLIEPRVQRIIVCVAAEDQQWPASEYARHPQILSTDGGATRAQSVLNGLDALALDAAPDDWVLVHDAARPCLSPDALARLLDELASHPVGGLLAVPCQDTLKREQDNSRAVAETLPRDNVWQAQTPQMFRFAVLRNALQTALQQGLSITDEASAIEHAGLAPQLVRGEALNIKITNPGDLELAQAILSARR